MELHELELGEHVSVARSFAFSVAAGALVVFAGEARFFLGEVVCVVRLRQLRRNELNLIIILPSDPRAIINRILELPTG